MGNITSLKMLGFINTVTCHFSNVFSVKLLYFSLVQYHLNYACSIYYPFYNCYSQRLEQIQHKFLYIAYKISNYHFNYMNDLPSHLNILPLSVRRKHKRSFKKLNFTSHLDLQEIPICFVSMYIELIVDITLLL